MPAYIRKAVIFKKFFVILRVEAFASRSAILNNRSKKKNLALIFRLQGHQQFKSRFAGMSTAEVMKDVWNYDITECPHCKAHKLVSFIRFYPMRC